MRRGLLPPILGSILLLLTSTGASAGPVVGLEPELLTRDAHYRDGYFHETRQFKILGSELMVQWRSQGRLEQIREQERRHALTVLHPVHPRGGYGHYRLTAGRDPFPILTALNLDPLVVSAYPVLTDEQGRPQHILGGELSVQFTSGMDDGTCLRVLKELGSRVVRQQRTPGYYRVTVPPGMSLFQAVRTYNDRREIRFAELSLVGYEDWSWVPDDPFFPEQQNLENTGQAPDCDGCAPFEEHDIRAVPAWDLHRGSPDIVIAVLDTGCDLDHPDLAANLVPREGEDWDFSAGEGMSPEDEHGHGTNVAGIVAAVADNGLGVAGVAPGCRIMPLKIDLAGGLIQDRADALNYVAQRRPLHAGMVACNSWRLDSGPSAAVYSAIENCRQEGVVVVFAAGDHDGTPVAAPADSSDCICVTALSPCDERKEPGSCDGEGWWGSGYGLDADLSAPGVLIRTTALGGGYELRFNGTSAACPHVAGAAALVLSLAPELDPGEVQSILESTARDLGSEGWDQEHGWGRIDLEAALTELDGVVLERSRVRCLDEVLVTVRDWSLPTTVEVELSSETEPAPELLVLQETGEPGIYQGSVQLSDQVGPIPGDGLVAVAEGDHLQAYSSDLEEGTTALVDCTPPEIQELEVVSRTLSQATISWKTDEPTDGRVHYGIGGPDQTAGGGRVGVDHIVQLTGLEPCAGYQFAVESRDLALNQTLDDNGGLNHEFWTLQRRYALEDDLSADPDWSFEAEWDWGRPRGLGGTHGSPDPTSGITGDEVIGYNLAGDYTNSLPRRRCTIGPIDCSHLTGSRVRFWRWLGVEARPFDQASVEVSNSLSGWVTVWENPDQDLMDLEWAEVNYDISAVADQQVEVSLRWTMGPTDTSWVYCGWNIDDVSIYADMECSLTPSPSPSPSPSPPPTSSPSPTETPATPSPSPTVTASPTISPTPTPSMTPGCPPGSLPVTLHVQEFEQWPLEDWTIHNLGGDCVWRAGSEDEGVVEPNHTGGTGDYADADSDDCGSGSDMETALLPPPLDLTEVLNPRLEFASDMDWRSGEGDELWTVEASTDGGQVWESLLIRQGQDFLGPEIIDLSLGAYVGASELRLRFRYGRANWDGWWQVDDVRVVGCQAAPTGGPTPSSTPTPGVSPTASTTPTPTPTAIGSDTPAPSPEPSPEPTSTPLTYGVRLDLPTWVIPGEDFWVTGWVDNPGPLRTSVPTFFVLEAEGGFWFWPDWISFPPEFDYQSLDLPSGTTEIPVLPSFPWPETGSQVMSGLRFHGLLLNQEMTAVDGRAAVVSWGFGPTHRAD